MTRIEGQCDKECDKEDDKDSDKEDGAQSRDIPSSSLTARFHAPFNLPAVQLQSAFAMSHKTNDKDNIWGQFYYGDSRLKVLSSLYA